MKIVINLNLMKGCVTTFNEQMDALKNFLYKRRCEDYNNIEVKIDEVQITNASCPYTVTIMNDG